MCSPMKCEGANESNEGCDMEAGQKENPNKGVMETLTMAFVKIASVFKLCGGYDVINFLKNNMNDLKISTKSLIKTLSRKIVHMMKSLTRRPETPRESEWHKAIRDNLDAMFQNDRRRADEIWTILEKLMKEVGKSTSFPSAAGTEDDAGASNLEEIKVVLSILAPLVAACVAFGFNASLSASLSHSKAIALDTAGVAGVVGIVSALPSAALSKKIPRASKVLENISYTSAVTGVMLLTALFLPDRLVWMIGVASVFPSLALLSTSCVPSCLPTDDNNYLPS